MHKFIVYILLLVTIIVGCAQSSYAADDKDDFIFVIDPGHGGKDLGAPGKNSYESKIVYDIAKRVKKLVEKEHPEVKVALTHQNDKYLKLWQRGEVANNMNADLFMSIHTNSLDKKNRKRTKFTGAEVYTLGLDKTEASLSVTQRENAVLEIEDDSTETYQDYDPNSPESQIIFEIYQNLNQRRSIEFAENIQKELISTAGRVDRGVKQANLGVLRSISMPGILVELDFICNPTVEKLFNSDKGKDMFARALANGFSNYYKHHSNHKQTTVANSDKSDNAGEIVYCVQFLTSPVKLKADDSKIKHVKGATYYIHDNTYKYICGSYSSFDEAKKRLQIIRKTYPEAFIIKMRNGERIK